MKESRLHNRLARLKAVLNTDKYLVEENSVEIVQKYYKLNRIAYKLFHNRHGFLHMGISKDGRYSNSDLLEPLKQISKYIENKSSFEVLELASGQGANTTYLAQIYNKVSFTALDYSTKPKKAFYKLNNTEFTFGDYHDLSKFNDTSFDLIFIIEALCHANDIAKVISEVQRVLKPGGCFIIFDAYFGKDPDSLNPYEVEASQLTATGMAVNMFEYIEDFRNVINQSDFELVEEINLSKNIIPTSKKFGRLAGVFVRLGFISKILAKLLPDMFIRNAISGYLIQPLIEEEIAVYYKHVLRLRTQ